MGVEDIGARLVIEDAGALATLQATRDEVNALTADLIKMGGVADATLAKIGKSGDKAAVSAGAAGASVTKAGAAAEDAGAAGATALGAHGAAVEDATVKTEALRKSTQNLKKDFQDVAASGVAKAGASMFAGAIGIAGESIDQYMKYQKSMTQLVTQAGLPANRLPAIMAGGLQIGKETGLNFNDIANQLYRIVSATSGLKETNKQILDLGKSAANIAVLFNVGSGAPTEQVARLFGSIANAARSNKLQDTGIGKGAAGIAALLNATVGTGDIRGQDLVGALGRGVLQSGQAAHAKLPDIMSWIDLSTRLGAQPSTSGTLIAHAIQQLVGGSEQAKHAEAMVGVTPSEMSQLVRTQGIGAAVKDLYTKAQSWNPLSYYPAFGKNAPGAQSAQAQADAWLLGTPAEMSSFYNNTASPQVRQNIESQLFAKMFGGARQEIPFLSIAENQGLYASIEKQIKAQSNSGTYNKDLSAAIATPSRQLQIGMRTLQAYSIELGQTLTPALVHFVHGIVDVAGFLNTHRAVLDGIVGTLGAFATLSAAVWVGGKVLKTIEGVTKFINLLGGVGSKILGIGGTVTGASPVVANTTELEINTGALSRLTEALVVSRETNTFNPFGTSKFGTVTNTTTTVERTAAQDLAPAAGGASALRSLMPVAIAAAATYFGVTTAHNYLESHGGGLTGVPGQVRTELTDLTANHGFKLGAPIIFANQLASTVGNYLTAHVGGATNRAGSALTDVFNYVNPFGSARPGRPSGAPPPPTVSGVNAQTQNSQQHLSALQTAQGRVWTNTALYGTNSQAAISARQYEQALINSQAQHTLGIRHGAGTQAGQQWALQYNLNHNAVSPLYRNGPYGEELVRRGHAGGEVQQIAAAMKQAFKDSARFGSTGMLHSTLTGERATLKLDQQKGSGATSQDIAQVKGEIAKTTGHLAILEADAKRISKTTDTAKQTSDLISAMKSNDSKNNQLLDQINSTLKGLSSSMATALGGVKLTVNTSAITAAVAAGQQQNAARK